MKNSNNRFNRFVERQDGNDFPFYDNSPHLSSWRWIGVVVSCVVAFALLSTVGFENQTLDLIPRTLFMAIPLAVFVLAVGPSWRSIFTRPQLKDTRLVMGFAFLSVSISAIVASVIQKEGWGAMAGNGATLGIVEDGPLNVTSFYIGTAVQILGEELFTILPFLGLLYWLHEKVGLSRRTAVIIAWIVTALWFGAAHLPTYDWNVLQALVVIGSARIVLTLVYIRTKNIWLSFGVHLLGDWSMFTFYMLTTG